MIQYIDKSALVAEIEKVIDILINNSGYIGAFGESQITVYEDVLSLINTLEVKEVDLEKDVRQILSLYYEGIKYYDGIIKKEREENGGSDLAIKIMDGVVDARELGIQYVIDKLKAQEGE